MVDLVFTFYNFFDRKRQRNILIKRKYKRRMRNPPTKEKQDYKYLKVYQPSFLGAQANQSSPEVILTL